jgi:uncharacterized protein YdaU (DUF1376 family)
MNFYPFHLGDYATHTRHLSLLEDLAYRRMIDLYYTSESPLPIEPESVARLIGMKDHLDCVKNVLSDFFLISEAGYTHSRCDREIAAYRAKAERAKSANISRWSGKSSDITSETLLKSDRDQIATNTITITKTNKEQDQKQGAMRPSWLDEADWESFKKHRGSKFTIRAQDMMIKQLSHYRDKGQDPNAMLQRSIANGWKGVFPEKQNGANNGPGYISERDKARKRVAKELCGYDSDAIAGVSHRVD